MRNSSMKQTAHIEVISIIPRFKWILSALDTDNGNEVIEVVLKLLHLIFIQ